MPLLLYFKGLNTYTKPRVLNLDLSNNVLYTPQGNDPDRWPLPIFLYLNIILIPCWRTSADVYPYLHTPQKRREKRSHMIEQDEDFIGMPWKSHIIDRQWTWVDSQEIFKTCNTLTYSPFASVLERCISDASHQCRQSRPMNILLQG